VVRVNVGGTWMAAISTHPSLAGILCYRAVMLGPVML